MFDPEQLRNAGALLKNIRRGHRSFLKEMKPYSIINYMMVKLK